MISILKRSRLTAACMCVAFAGASALTVRTFADDTSSKESVMTEQLSKLHDETKDDSKKEKMTDELAKMMVMHKMAMMMAMDSTSSKMLADDSDATKLVEDAKAMAKDPEKMKSIKAEIMKDPHAMKMVMMMDMISTEMMKDKDSDKSGMDKSGMDKSAMEKMKEKMQDKMK